MLKFSNVISDGNGWWWCCVSLHSCWCFTMLKDECNRIFSANSRVILCFLQCIFVCHLSFSGIVYKCAIVCVSLHLSLINFSLRHGSPENFWPTRRKRKKLTFFNWMLWNEWKDKNHLGKKRLSYSNKTIVRNVRKKSALKIIAFCSMCQKIIYFVYGILMVWNL